VKIHYVSPSLLSLLSFPFPHTYIHAHPHTHLLKMLILLHIETGKVKKLVIPCLGQSFQTIQDGQVEGADTGGRVMERGKRRVDGAERTVGFFRGAVEVEHRPSSEEGGGVGAAVGVGACVCVCVCGGGDWDVGMIERERAGLFVYEYVTYHNRNK
jgi:hypothetical protein